MIIVLLHAMIPQKNVIVINNCQNFFLFSKSNPTHWYFKTPGKIQDCTLYTFISSIHIVFFYNRLSTEMSSTTKTRPHQAHNGTQHSQQLFNIWGRCHNFQCLLCNRLGSEPSEPGAIILTSYILKINKTPWIHDK